MAFLYIIKNEHNKYYVGITELPVLERLQRHNKGDVRSTKSGKPWKIVHTESYVNMREARAREKQVKSWKGGNMFKKLVCE